MGIGGREIPLNDFFKILEIDDNVFDKAKGDADTERRVRDGGAI